MALSADTFSGEIRLLSPREAAFCIKIRWEFRDFFAFATSV